MIKTATVDIRISKSIDEITIKDIEDILSGTNTIPVEITAHKQVDQLFILRPPADNLTILD